MRLFFAAALAVLTISCSDDQDPTMPTTDESTGEASTGEPAGSSGGESTGAAECAPGAPCDPAIVGVCGTLMECSQTSDGFLCIRVCTADGGCEAAGGGSCAPSGICMNGDAYAGKCFFE